MTQRLSAQDLHRRYRNGERYFAGVDLSGESLRGMNLRGIDLSKADLSRTDIRGTNFADAKLVRTQFVEAKAGTQRRWLIPQLLIAFVLSALASFLTGIIWGLFANSIFSPTGDTTGTVAGDVVFGVLGTVVLLAFLVLIYARGILAAFGAALFAFAVAFAVAGAVAFAFAVAASIVGVAISTIVSFLIARRALSGDTRDQLVRSIAVWFGSFGGTQFAGADLTEATFEKAVLKSAHFYGSTLVRTRFHLAKKLNLARLGHTLLADFTVQNLLLSLRGKDQSYQGLNLKGANLAGVELAGADFTEADLSQATLEGANLARTTLIKTQALGTQFRQAELTGACLEAWNIDSTTQLEGAICDYVYLLSPQQERRPSSGTFQPGEFTKLFEEVLDTIDLIFRDGVDWKAFQRTLGQISVQYEEAELAVQSIENKGDGVVVVRLNAAPGADKPAIHQSFTEIYQLALKEAEARYKGQLDAKDEQIADYRQQSANMQEVLKVLAARPITVDVKAIAESKAMQGNDSSRNITVGGNVTNSALQTGDANTASIQFQQASLPQPESVDIQAELMALKAILASLNDPVTSGVADKLAAEAAKANPDKSVISTTLETGLTYAQNLQGFAEAIDKLRPHVQNAAAWLGGHSYKLLALVGLAI